MPSSLLQPSRHISVLLVDPDRDFARKAQSLLFSHFSDSLDLSLAGSLHDGLTHLCTHQVRLIILGPALPGQRMSDTIHALRVAAPNKGILVYGMATDESFRLDALRAGAHEVACISDVSPDTFKLAIERTLARSWQQPAGATISITPQLIHDLNNAITAINGFADILFNTVHSDTQSRACVEQIRNAGTRAAGLLNTVTPSVSRQETDTYTARAA